VRHSWEKNIKKLTIKARIVTSRNKSSRQENESYSFGRVTSRNVAMSTGLKASREIPGDEQ
jgi:hypothetical protein